jgi:lipid A 3-O-deacylase PagL
VRSAYAGILALVVSTAATAQSRTWEIGVTAGGGPSIVTASLGGVSDRQLFVTSVFVTRPFLRWGRLSASYFGEVMPVVVATKVPKFRGSWFYNPTHTDSTFLLFPHGDGPDLGGGIAPVGLRLAFRVSPGVSVFAEGNGGGVAFARAMPEPLARSLNFLGSAGAGLRFGSAERRSLIIGYRFTHLSNANTAVNPGFNAHVFYLGITFH